MKRMFLLVGLVGSFIGTSAWAQAPFCQTSGVNASCNNISTSVTFLGLSSPGAYDVRVVIPAGLMAAVDPNLNGTSGVCALWAGSGSTVGQIGLRLTDPLLKEKWALIQAAHLSGRKIWFDISRESLTNSRCVFNFIGLM